VGRKARLKRERKQMFGRTDGTEYDTIELRNPQRTNFNAFIQAPYVDHCHDSGKLRDLLCSRCNVALGQADDSPERLEAMAAYIRKHNQPSHAKCN
jgi:hypothetical protein